MAKAVVTLEVEIDPMTVEEQIEEMVDPENAEEFEVGDDEAFQVANAIAAHLPNADDLLAGTNLMLHVRDVTVLNAELGATHHHAMRSTSAPKTKVERMVEALRARLLPFEESTADRRYNEAIRDAINIALSSPSGEPAPIPMLLFCPMCGIQHIDEPDEDWDNPPHRSHLCHGCGCIWRPADVATTGVVRIETAGKADTWGESNSAAIAKPIPHRYSRHHANERMVEQARELCTEAADEIERLRGFTNTSVSQDAFNAAAEWIESGGAELIAAGAATRPYAEFRAEVMDMIAPTKPDRETLKEKIASILAADPRCAGRVTQATVDRIAALVRGG